MNLNDMKNRIINKCITNIKIQIMKGKDHFTRQEITALRQLIRIRVGLSQQSGTKNEQKKVRDKMRAIGFYGGDDWGIFDCQESDLDRLIDSGQIKVES